MYYVNFRIVNKTCFDNSTYVTDKLKYVQLFYTQCVSQVFNKIISADNLVFAIRKTNWYFYAGNFHPYVREVIPPASLIPAENNIEKRGMQIKQQMI